MLSCSRMESPTRKGILMSTAVDIPRSAPVKATWICLVIGWLLFLLPVPGLGLFAGWPMNLVAFILAIVVMARGRIVAGLIPLLASLIASPAIYLIGLAIFSAVIGGSSYGDYVEGSGSSHHGRGGDSDDDD